MPQFLTISFESFQRYKGDWLLWRNLGHYEQTGAWIAPVSYSEAQDIPKAMLEVFFELDDWLSKMMKQKEKHGK